METDTPASLATVVRTIAEIMEERGLSRLTFHKIDNTVKVEGVYYYQFKVGVGYHEGF